MVEAADLLGPRAPEIPGPCSGEGCLRSTFVASQMCPMWNEIVSHLLLPGAGPLYERLIGIMDKRPAEDGFTPILIAGIQWLPLVNMRGEFIFLERRPNGNPRLEILGHRPIPY